jgi:hypothetical protein
MIGSEGEPFQGKAYGIYPYNTFRRGWEFVMFTLGMLIVWEIPWEWAFNPHRTFYYLIPALVIDLCFLVDIFIVLRTGVLQYGVIKLDKTNIRNSIETWRLAIYWISPWPYYLIGYYVHNDTVFCALMTLKVLRFLRLYDAIQVIRNTLIYINPISRLVLLFGAFLTIAHYSACIFWYTGYDEVPGSSWLIDFKLLSQPREIQYFHTLYYITTTFLTIGYGDLHPVTFEEICVALACQIVGVFFYNFVVSNMVSIVADPSRNSFLSKYQRIHSAFRGRGVSDESLEELLKYYEYVWERDRDRADFYETAAKLPEGLQKKLALALHMDVFNKVPALQGADEEALEKVAMALRPRIFTPGDFLIKAERVSNRMYFVTAGKVAIMNTNGAIFQTLDGVNGFVLGEASVLSGAVEPASAIAETYVDAFELMKEDFDEIVAMHPEIQAQLARK